MAKLFDLDVLNLSEAARGLIKNDGIQERPTPIEKSRPKYLVKISSVELTD